MKQRITIGDVARVAGVSKQTVSRAINDKGEISASTKERIMQVVGELGYRPNRLARAMSTKNTFMVGLVVPDITNPFFPEVARGVQDAALARDYNVLMCNTDAEPDTEIQTLEMLTSQGVDGIIIFSGRVTREQLAEFAKVAPPIVTINRDFKHPALTPLMVDNLKGARLATEHFIQQGHTQIGMLTNKDYTPSQVRRVQGYRNTLERNGLSTDQSRIISEQPTLEGGYRATKALLEKHPLVSAIFCYNDLMALGAIRACFDLNKNVPNDVAIVGFDDIQLASMYSPALSSVQVDQYDIGRQAFQVLMQAIAQPDTQIATKQLDVNLVLRESTRPKAT